ncbi:membrane protein [Alicyclobacillus tengchongensis]|nr:membrane protein [Alicyclobacillus tengchongensis]
MSEKGEVAMRKVTAVLLALGIAGGVVVGCGVPGSNKSVTHKIQEHAETLDSKNYQSEAMMTVQMDNNVQKYFVRVSYESQDTYKIELGNAEKQINQIIVRNPSGMFIVSPALGKVFRFNGNWAQNQGQIYLYNQLLNQITAQKSVKVQKNGGVYSFDVPVTPASDVISREQIVLSKDLNPQTVKLLDKNGAAAVTLTYQSFTTGVTFPKDAFDPQALAQSGQVAKPTLASDQSFDYVEPPAEFGTKLTDLAQPTDTSVIMRYSGGNHHYVLTESEPTPGAEGIPSAQLLNMFGVPAIYNHATGTNVSNITWINNGIEFSLTSNDMNLDQLQDIAISTFGQVGK